MNYTKEILKRAAFGLPIGIAIGATFSLVFAFIFKDRPSDEFRELDFYLVSYIVSAVIGAVYAASSIIWDVEKWSLRTQTVTHFCITLVTHLSSALIATWIPFKLKAILIYASIYIVIYLIIYLIIFSVQRKRVNALNEVLEK